MKRSPVKKIIFTVECLKWSKHSKLLKVPIYSMEMMDFYSINKLVSKVNGTYISSIRTSTVAVYLLYAHGTLIPNSYSVPIPSSIIIFNYTCIITNQD